jgi:hypothetical protein
MGGGGGSFGGGGGGIGSMDRWVHGVGWVALGTTTAWAIAAHTGTLAIPYSNARADRQEKVIPKAIDLAPPLPPRSKDQNGFRVATSPIVLNPALPDRAVDGTWPTDANGVKLATIARGVGDQVGGRRAEVTVATAQTSDGVYHFSASGRADSVELVALVVNAAAEAGQPVQFHRGALHAEVNLRNDLGSDLIGISGAYGPCQTCRDVYGMTVAGGVFVYYNSRSTSR